MFASVECQGGSIESTIINGNLNIDSSWDSKIYLSLIPSFEDMYLMSDEMIIAEADIDSLGNFELNMDFLPKGENLYRLHLAKRGDSRATLIIGGREENHCFLIIDHPAQFELFNSSAEPPPFRKVAYPNSSVNQSFQKLNDFIFIADSVAAQSSAAKRKLIKEQFEADMKSIVDSSTNLLISLHAINQLPLAKTLESNPELYGNFTDKWNIEGNAYFNEFKRKLPERTGSTSFVVFTLAGLVLIIGGVLVVLRFRKPKSALHTLSIQERKVFDLVYQGMSNQEIADELNIGLSTVKSHVSSIYSKLNIKSRKEILQVK
ncbi:MAG: LuxR C-terminal-related transcriptional regulator [Bacteroidota bacterium]